MSGKPRPEDPAELSVSEDIPRVQDLWDEIARDPRNVALTQIQREELGRRLRDHEQSPGQYRSWEDIRRSLESGE